ncbi:tRNA (N(6)-L-threonylcarbamoyladenosine(37)-C(2))-methylthiotransferase MtaB [uncultured Thiodictyon sp.]|uniref:tRNA (N(6)-L-threonylcarbamoyladenosine(37)-C(2))- methylthiotransferase MtaB n=1 Tax=uncultured Thiodictyon sp. TaxID=1846217 RepID=UPI0025D5EEF3|nr:tRNA (N(6)-L-threonylcarbamoyladenosine(37)-C(2))-methylthiotransferase MtaB [uncultured Thiodictyon sp.]
MGATHLTAPPTGTRPRVLLKALGCRLNEAELEDWAAGFRARGFVLAGDDEPADLIVINTCAVTAEATRKSRQWLRRAHRANPLARLVVSGCLASLEAADLARESGVDLVVGNQDKDRLVEIAAAALSLPIMPELAIVGSANPLFARGRQRAFIKVQDGCRHACTFCVTTLARGTERSRPLPEIIEAINHYSASGVREVLLTGVHLGGYSDTTGADLSALVRAVLRETAIPRARLGSLEPWDLPADFWELFADPRLMPHLHLPMQSGSDAMLRRMARRCKSDEFARLAGLGRSAVPQLNLTTDIIVGFPGESDAEWQETLAFVAAMAFGQVHCFSYSPRAGTRAASLPGQVDAQTKRQRVLELKALADRLQQQMFAAQVGRDSQVLREGQPRAGQLGDLFGYTPNYLPVRIDAHPDAAAVGEVMDVTIRGIDPDGATLRGCLRDQIG